MTFKNITNRHKKLLARVFFDEDRGFNIPVTNRVPSVVSELTCDNL